MSRLAPSLGRVVVAAALLLGGLSAALALVGSPSSAGVGPLALPDPAPLTSVRYDQPPLKVLLVGDSMAGSLGVGLETMAPAYNVELANAGHPGCSLSMDGQIQLTYNPANPGSPCVLDHPEALLTAWKAWVDAFRPDVVLYLARSDLINQQVDGAWTNVGHRDFNRWYEQRLRQGIAVLSSQGARVVLMAPPVSLEPTLNRRPADNPIRVARIGALLRFAAADDPGSVSIYDLDRLLTPGFHYRASVDGLSLRCADGVHVTPEAGIVVASDLYPRLWALTATSRVPGGGRWTTGAIPSTPPPWYQKLPCG